MFNKAMTNKGGKRKNGENSDLNVVDYERVRKEQIAKNEEYMSSLRLINK